MAFGLAISVPCKVLWLIQPVLFIFFFFNDTATTEIYTLSLHDALPIFFLDIASYTKLSEQLDPKRLNQLVQTYFSSFLEIDRKSTRLNSSHSQISYAVFCLKKKHNTANSSSSIAKTRDNMGTSH